MIWPLHGEIRSYEWGDRHTLPHLLGRVPTGEPQAEFWMGAHPAAPSLVEYPDGRTERLDRVIDDDPAGLLGSATAEKFGRLPFLFKVLAAAEPLSIQVHPTAEAAAAGFAREERLGLPADAPTRVYRDPYHKPELVCALEPFSVLCGFRPVSATLDELATADGPHTAALAAVVGASGDEPDVLKNALSYLLELPAGDASELNAELVQLDRDGLYQLLADRYPDDPGVGVATLMNHLVLAPGEAAVLEARTLHAYLGGVAVEIMANSDNVIRGGLTPKHIDIEELLTTVDTTPAALVVEAAVRPVHRYASSVAEFTLTRAALAGGVSFEIAGPAILLAVDGDGVASPVAGGVTGAPMPLQQGRPHFLTAGTVAVVRAATDEEALVFAASVAF